MVPRRYKQWSGPMADACTRNRTTGSVSVGSQGSTIRTTALARPVPQCRRGVHPVDPQRDRVDVETLDHGEVHRLGPADDCDHLILVEEWKRCAEAVGRAVGFQESRRLPRTRPWIGGGEDARADPPQRSARPVVREYPAARDHEARRLRRESLERVGGFDREAVFVDVAAGDRSEALRPGSLHPTCDRPRFHPARLRLGARGRVFASIQGAG